MPSSPLTDKTSFWTDVRGVFVGKHQDYTTLPLGRAIALLAIPMVLEMLMQSAFSIVDIYFVGKLGADAVAAVGLTDSLLILVLAIGMGLGMAATAMVSRRIGEKDRAGAEAAAFQVLLAGLGVSLPIGLLGFLFAPELLALMGASAEVVETGTGYCRILFGTNASILFIFLINAIFRGAGDAVLAMRTLWLANLINIILDPALIFGWGPLPELGVTGAAVATTIGRSIGVAYQLTLLVRGNGRIRLHLGHLHLEMDLMRRLFRVALPGMLQYLIGTASWLGLFRILTAFGSDAMAGYTIALRILVFALLPSWGMGNAAATLVGQNLGARQPDRAERSVWMAGTINMIFLGMVAIAMHSWGDFLVGIFTKQPEVIAYGASCLRIVSYTYIFFALGMVTVQAFNGAGDTKTPTWINLFCYWIIQIPLAYTLSHRFDLGAEGIFMAIATTQATLALVGVILFRKGYWKTKVL